MFEDLFPSRPPAPYQDDASAAGFRLVAGDAAQDPDAKGLVSVHGEIRNCMIGEYEGRRVAVFENIFGGGSHRARWMTLAFDIGDHDFRETNSLASSWNIRRDDHWVYFEATVEFQRWPNLSEFLRDANAILELYLL